jgi:sugar lactone lactonase YvrE
MKNALTTLLALTLVGCASTAPTTPPKLSILVDLDPASVERTVIVENITADRNGMLYTGDRVSGNLLRIDPANPKPVVVGRLESRTVNERVTPANPGGLVLTAQGDLLVVAAGFGEVMRLRAADLNPANPTRAQTFATGLTGANGIALDAKGQVYVSGGATGAVYRLSQDGTAFQTIAKIEPFTRTLPNVTATQTIVANGLAFDAKGVLHVADTARGAVWTVAIGADGQAAAPKLLAQSPLLEGADGIAFDPQGQLWVSANELNALATVTPNGQVTTVARNGNAGPLEFPASIVFVGNTAYVPNFDVPRRDNLDVGANTSRSGVGASIVRLQR